MYSTRNRQWSYQNRGEPNHDRMFNQGCAGQKWHGKIKIKSPQSVESSRRIDWTKRHGRNYRENQKSTRKWEKAVNEKTETKNLKKREKRKFRSNTISFILGKTSDFIFTLFSFFFLCVNSTLKPAPDYVCGIESVPEWVRHFFLTYTQSEYSEKNLPNVQAQHN
jgi:hypothetical protein